MIEMPKIAADGPVQHQARIQISIELLMQMLDMPTDVRLVDVRHNPWHGPHIEMLLESPHLPAVQEGEMRPIITPVYRRVEVGGATMIEFRGYVGELDGPVRRGRPLCDVLED